MSVFEINSIERLNKLIEICSENNKYLVIKASTEWCGPCKTIKPKYEQLAREMIDKAVFTTFDVDEQKDIADQFKISAMPTFIVIKDNDILTQFSGANLKELKTILDQ